MSKYYRTTKGSITYKPVTSGMRSYVKPQNLAIAFLLLFIVTIAGKAQTSVRIVFDKVDIFSKPDINYQSNFSAQKGDHFKVEDILGEWIQVQMFSGAKRYIKSSGVELISKVPPDASDPSILNKFCNRIEKAQSKAEKEAISRFARKVRQQREYKRLLLDKYVLDTFRVFDISATHTSKLLECVDDSFI